MATKINPLCSRIIVQRTLEHLRRGNAVISDDIASIAMNTDVEGGENLGARHFLYENIPQLKYKSSHVKFDLQKHANSDAFLTITYRNGCEKHISCSYKSSSSILDEVKKLCTK